MAALVNPAGDLVLDYAYDPFGSETGYQPDNADQWDNPFRYCGEYWDEETETYYLRARQYDPETGRFLSEDTHWNPGNMLYGDHPRQLSWGLYTPNMPAIKQSGNAYVYCVNDPLKYMDASGEIATWVVLALYGYAQAIASSPDLQFDIEMLAFDISQGDYVSAAFDVVDILAPGISGSKMIPKFISKYFDDAVDAVKSSKRVKSGLKFHDVMFNEEKVMGHIFSKAHIRDGIMNLGDGRKDIYAKILDVVETASDQLVEGDNGIAILINEIETTINVNVYEGAIRNLDAFVGQSARKYDNFIDLIN